MKERQWERQVNDAFSKYEAAEKKRQFEAAVAKATAEFG